MFPGKKKKSSVTRPARELFSLCIEHLPNIFPSVRPSHCIFQPGLSLWAFRNIFPVMELFQIKRFLIYSDQFRTQRLIPNCFARLIDMLENAGYYYYYFVIGFRLVLANVTWIDKPFRLKIRFVSTRNLPVVASDRATCTIASRTRTTSSIWNSPSYSILKYHLFNQCNQS